MKKIISILLTVSLLILSAFSFAACDKNESDEVATNATLINGFEEYKADFEPMLLLNFFGKVDVNKDARFVKTGAQSARLFPSGDATETTTARPTLKQPLNLIKSGINVSDITKLSMFTAEVYNDSTADADGIVPDVNMTVQMQIGGTIIGDKIYTLKAGWNTVIYETFASTWDISYNVTGISGLLFAFDMPGTASKTPILYLDDIKAYTTDKELESLRDEVAPDEILSFDQYYQLYTVKALERFGKFNTKVSINTNPIYAQSGYSLRMDMTANDDSLPIESYVGVEISQKYLGSCGLDKYTDNDTFSFSVFNASNANQTIFFEWFNADNKIFFKPEKILVAPNSWLTKTYTINDMNKRLGVIGQGTGNAGKIIITYKASAVGSDASIYLDSFKMNKAEQGV